MAATFSFNCPQCGKTYENINAKMAGRKVSCTCGKVFRLGPKTEAQVAAKAKRKAEKLAARHIAVSHPPTLPTVAIPSKSAPKKPAQPPVRPRLFETDIPGLEDEPDAKLVTPTTNHSPVNPGAFENDPFLENPVTRSNAQAVESKIGVSHGSPPLGWALATPEPTKKAVDKKSTTTFETKDGRVAHVLDWFANLFSRRS